MASNKSKNISNGDESSKPAVTSKADAKATKPDKAKAAKSSKAKKASDKKPGFATKVRNYFSGVRTEVKRVVWPTRPELVKYSVAVVVMLIFFGLLIYLVDTAIVPLLVLFSGLRG